MMVQRWGKVLCILVLTGLMDGLFAKGQEEIPEKQELPPMAKGMKQVGEQLKELEKEWEKKGLSEEERKRLKQDFMMKQFFGKDVNQLRELGKNVRKGKLEKEDALFQMEQAASAQQSDRDRLHYDAWNASIPERMKREIGEWVELLNDDDYKTREEAERILLEMSTGPRWQNKMVETVLSERLENVTDPNFRQMGDAVLKLVRRNAEIENWPSGWVPREILREIPVEVLRWLRPRYTHEDPLVRGSLFRPLENVFLKGPAQGKMIKNIGVLHGYTLPPDHPLAGRMPDGMEIDSAVHLLMFSFLRDPVREVRNGALLYLSSVVDGHIDNATVPPMLENRKELYKPHLKYIKRILNVEKRLLDLGEDRTQDPAHYRVGRTLVRWLSKK